MKAVEKKNKMYNRFICDICGKAFPLMENGYSKYYLLNNRAVCWKCYDKARNIEIFKRVGL